MSNQSKLPPLLREPIGPVGTDPDSGNPDLESLTELERSLRESLMKEFNARRAKKFVGKQVKYINANLQLAEGLGALFDENGQPPANAPLEDIVEERRRIEAEVKLFEAIVAELHSRLVSIREIEDGAYDLLSELPSSDRPPAGSA